VLLVKVTMAAEAAWVIATAIAATKKAILVDIEHRIDMSEPQKNLKIKDLPSARSRVSYSTMSHQSFK
jgi:hypothetical protein